MTESAFTRKLLRALRGHAALRGAVIWKLNDRTTGGIPDILVQESEGHTTFWEVKIAPNGCTKLQKYYLDRLRFSWVVVASADGRTCFLSPSDMTPGTFEELVEEIVRRCVDA